MAYYVIRQGFSVFKDGVFYTSGQSVELTNQEFELHKHKFENVSGSVFPNTNVNPNPNNGSNILSERIDRRTLSTDLTLSISDVTYQHLINSAGRTVNVFLPLSPYKDLKFALINNQLSNGSIQSNQTLIFPGDRYEIIFDGVEWVEL